MRRKKLLQYAVCTFVDEMFYKLEIKLSIHKMPGFNYE